jgi:hypothetical protein
MTIRALMTFLFASFVLAIFIVLGFHIQQTGSATFFSSYLTGLSNWWDKMSQVQEVSSPVTSTSAVTLPTSSVTALNVAPANKQNSSIVNNKTLATSIPDTHLNASNNLTSTLSDKTITLPANDSNNSNRNMSMNSDNVSKVASDSTGNRSNTAPVCMTYGPLNLEQKALFDVILKKSNLDNLPAVSQRPVYQIYWDLGKDKVQAITLFEKQKNGGALQDERFKLSQQDNGEWIVPIATISGNEQMAQTISSQLDAKAHAGGKWTSQPMGDGYFYRFKDLNLLPADSLNLMDKAVNVTKSPC